MYENTLANCGQVKCGINYNSVVLKGGAIAKMNLPEADDELFTTFEKQKTL